MSTRTPRARRGSTSASVAAPARRRRRANLGFGWGKVRLALRLLQLPALGIGGYVLFGTPLLRHATELVSENPWQEVCLFMALGLLPYLLARLEIVPSTVQDVIAVIGRVLTRVRGRHSVAAHLVLSASLPLRKVAQSFLYFLMVNLMTNAVPDAFEVDVPKILRFLDANGDGTLEAAEIEGFVYALSSRIFSALVITQGLDYLNKLRKPPAGWTAKESRKRGDALAPLERYWQRTSAKAGWWTLLDRTITGLMIVACAYTWFVTMGFSPRTILATGGAGGLAFGFAAQHVVGNGVAALMLLATAPCAVGDSVEVGEADLRYRGVVCEIGCSATKLDLRNGEYVYVPNSLMLSTALVVVESKGIAEACWDIWDSVDVNNDGKLSASEVFEALQSNQKAAEFFGVLAAEDGKVPPDAFERLFKELDMNKDGSITRYDFESWVRLNSAGS